MKKRKAPVPKPNLAASTQPIRAAREAVILGSEQGGLKENGKWKEEERLGWVRCPFSGRAYISTEGAIGLILTGINWDQEKAIAIINNKILMTGEKVGPYTVVSIEKEKVILNDGADKLELRLSQ
ncbi:MAG: hypothetical protein ABIG56_06060 [Candidatus Omnitrophota bacterium]